MLTRLKGGLGALLGYGIATLLAWSTPGHVEVPTEAHA
jgi:hypothetical protein